jgi:polysaccharide biosynthesis/export protein
MFRISDETAVQHEVASAESNYVIQKNDVLSIEVFTNQGERIIDPNLEAFREGTGQAQSEALTQTYVVDTRGVVKIPLVNEIKLMDLTIRQAEEILQQEYAKYYQDPFVVLRFTNKRVVVLGAPGGIVVPLNNENTRLTEVLAISKAITNDARANNIRILRGDKIYLADLSTVEGYIKNNMTMEPGDIIYIEPVRRPFSEGLRDYGPVISIITSIGTLIIIILQVQ